MPCVDITQVAAFFSSGDKGGRRSRSRSRDPNERALQEMERAGLGENATLSQHFEASVAYRKLYGMPLPEVKPEPVDESSADQYVWGDVRPWPPSLKPFV